MLSVTDLTCARGGVPVTEGVTFRLEAGEALVLRGPNGIGKTTLLRVIAGLAPPLSGSVEGAERIAYAGHADGIKAQLSVTENLRFWAATFGTSDIAPALEGFNLGELRGRLAGTLSAGQKRRLGLARLLVTGRPVWVLDEPTVSLDTASVGLFAAAVRAHLAAGGAALMATHIDLGLAEARILDLAPYKAKPQTRASDFDEAFL
ncbi:heme ABC exporter ATP-binding protein CcmA [Mangrovicoccus sp. HB161399]|uniref:heme ABC exporter ATP-binding protein CcmA n=1 Tax=Mangrovicoccus sp. HB161399 TaxID=2720392 RepID=UPI001553BF02|nr:heme ABC exporter ATP-binding protein CcmA [Mangrovicoccus sp. HB161399]